VGSVFIVVQLKSPSTVAAVLVSPVAMANPNLISVEFEVFGLVQGDSIGSCSMVCPWPSSNLGWHLRCIFPQIYPAAGKPVRFEGLVPQYSTWNGGGHPGREPE
jgi:hypothetical protein